jgi:hypothetical protein
MDGLPSCAKSNRIRSMENQLVIQAVSGFKRKYEPQKNYFSPPSGFTVQLK